MEYYVFVSNVCDTLLCKYVCSYVLRTYSNMEYCVFVSNVCDTLLCKYVQSACMKEFLWLLYVCMYVLCDCQLIVMVTTLDV